MVSNDDVAICDVCGDEDFLECMDLLNERAVDDNGDEFQLCRKCSQLNFFRGNIDSFKGGVGMIRSAVRSGHGKFLKYNFSIDNLLPYFRDNVYDLEHCYIREGRGVLFVRGRSDSGDPVARCVVLI